MKISEVSLEEVSEQLASGGVGLRLGLSEFRIESSIRQIAQAVHTLHAHHPFRPSATFADFRVRLEPGILRFQPSVVASVNDQVWHTWHRRLSVAAMEWICSWTYFRGSYRAIAIHAAAAALPNGPGAIIFPGDSGSGKSTLASTLMLSGWNLLSDEVALIDLEGLTLTALARPTILKGHSLDLIAKRFPEQAVFGPCSQFSTPRQSIAHLRPTEACVRIGGQKFQPAAFVFPSRKPGAKLELEPLSPGQSFALISQFGINYRMQGEAGFRAVLRLARRCPAYRLHYEDAGEAESFLRENSRLFELSDASGIETSGKRRTVADNEPVWKPSSEVVGNGKSANVNSINPKPDHRATSSAGSEGDKHPIGMLIDGLRDPDILASLTLREWDRLVPLANHTELLPRLAHQSFNRPWWGTLPEPVQNRLAQEVQLSNFNRIGICFELRQLERILAPICDRLVLLKGAAYLQADFPWARGRRTSDVDLLVPVSSLPAIETVMAEQGYRVSEDLSPADDRYYRRWLHEIPALQHDHRRLEVDLHFRLLPIADPLTFPVDEEISRSLPLPGGSYRILDPVDRVLHASLNLARTGEFRRGLRDLWDIGCMIRSSGDGDPPDQHIGRVQAKQNAFDWNSLIKRTKSHGLSSPVLDILLLGEELVGYSLPEDLTQKLGYRNSATRRRRWLYRVMHKAITPSLTSVRSRGRQLAMWGMEHYPLPRLRTWLDPLTWTKRWHWMQD